LQDGYRSPFPVHHPFAFFPPLLAVLDLLFSVPCLAFVTSAFKDLIGILCPVLYLCHIGTGTTVGILTNGSSLAAAISAWIANSKSATPVINAPILTQLLG
jgi:hypothetical protein